MQIGVVKIDDAAITRLPWEDLMEVLDAEYETSKKETIRVLKTARREFGLEVGDGEGSTEEGNQQE